MTEELIIIEVRDQKILASREEAEDTYYKLAQQLSLVTSETARFSEKQIVNALRSIAGAISVITAIQVVLGDLGIEVPEDLK